MNLDSPRFSPVQVMPRIVFAIVVFAYVESTSSAVTYYVSNSGSDENPGTESQPWKTISNVDSATSPGDEIVVMKGIYPGLSMITAPGITIRGEVTQAARSSRLLKSGDVAAVQLESLKLGDHQTVRDLYFSTDSIDEIVGVAIGGNSNTILNCRFNGGYKHAIAVHHSAGLNKVQRCIIDGFYRNGVKVSVNHTNLTEGNLIEGNILCNSQAADGVQFEGGFLDPATPVNRATVIRNNVIFGNMENGIDLKTSAYVVMEGNIIYGNMGSPDGRKGIAPVRCSANARAVMFGGHRERVSKNHIFRNNIVYDNPGGVQMYEGWKIYNNSIVGNARVGNSWRKCLQSPAIASGPHKKNPRMTIDNSSAKNNIIGDHSNPFNLAHLHPSVAIDYNYYYNTDLDLADWQKRLSQAGLKEAEQHSLMGSNPFVNVATFPTGAPTNYDFKARASAPTQDKGGYLTKASRGGSGTELPVEDSLYFFDGFGVTEGDVIQLEGPSKRAQVMAVDYEANTLELDQPLSWHKGQGISLAYNGKAPDIGADPVVDLTGFQRAEHSLSDKP